MINRIIITNDHLALARQMQIDGSKETPMVDQQKPYGSEDIAADVLHILGEKKNNGDYPQQMRQQALSIHKEMALVLQAWLYTGEIKTGEFKRIDGEDGRRWVEI